MMMLIDAEMTRHQILRLGHDSLARRRHSVRLNLRMWELGGVEERRSRGEGEERHCILAPGLDRSCL